MKLNIEKKGIISLLFLCLLNNFSIVHGAVDITKKDLSGYCNTCPWFSFQNIEWILLCLVIIFSILATYLTIGANFMKKINRINMNVKYIGLFLLFSVSSYFLLYVLSMYFTYS